MASVDSEVDSLCAEPIFRQRRRSHSGLISNLNLHMQALEMLGVMFFKKYIFTFLHSSMKTSSMILNTGEISEFISPTIRGSLFGGYYTAVY